MSDKPKFNLVEPGHPLVLIVFAMRTFDSADEAIEKMIGHPDIPGIDEAAEVAVDFIREVQEGQRTIHTIPQDSHKPWRHLATVDGKKFWFRYNRGRSQAQEMLEEFLDLASRWKWGREIQIPIRPHMQKFHVQVEIEFPDAVYNVWGDDTDEVQKAFEDTDMHDLFNNMEILITVREIPEAPSYTITDGVVTEKTGWVHGPSFKDENGERIFPTDKEQDDTQRVNYRYLEQQGQMRLPIEK
jgi:hypothetical protein